MCLAVLNDHLKFVVINIMSDQYTVFLVWFLTQGISMGLFLKKKTKNLENLSLNGNMREGC